LPRRQRRKASNHGPRLRLPVRLRYLALAGLVAVGGGALAAHWATAVAWLDRRFPVERVAVAGELRREDPEALAAWLAGRIEGGFFTADLEGLRRAVAARPWVREARLRRRWPGTLALAVSEHRAAARWRPEQGAAWRLVSRQGAVFQPRRLPDGGALPRLEGPRPRLGELRRRLADLDGRLGADHAVTALAVDSRGDWTARVDGRLALHFGRDHWDRRLARLMRVARGWRLLERRVARVDLRYPDGLAVAVARDEAPGGDGRAQPETGGSPAAARM